MWAKAAASPQNVVQSYTMCVRSSTGANLDYEYCNNATLTSAGTEYYRAAKTFAPGTYRYYPCVNDGSWQAIGASKTFTVAGTGSSSGTPTPAPTLATSTAAPAAAALPHPVERWSESIGTCEASAADRPLGGAP